MEEAFLKKDIEIILFTVIFSILCCFLLSNKALERSSRRITTYEEIKKYALKKYSEKNVNLILSEFKRD
jgi:hypothetical protein